jgi:hypothetical protein
MLKVNIYTKEVIFHSPILPAMDFLSSTTARFFKTTNYVSERGFVIGVSFDGPLQKHNQGGTDTEISLTGGFTRGALLTNV